jgi:FtsP/CotA-like multicopper oxidase with cupredoxin domain
MWQASLMPGSYSVMDMGYLDEGRPAGPAHAGHEGHDAAARSVASLTEPSSAAADVHVDLTARRESFRLASGGQVDGYTLNGSSPGPLITARQGQLVEVRLTNESVPDGITLHWHGLDVPNAEDGVAGVTQDAVPVGGAHVYRFRADQVGTFWYHSHQVSHEQVQRGLLGALVIVPPAGLPDTVDALALVHEYDGVRTINGRAGDSRVDAPPGARVRVRVINTADGPMPVWVGGAPFRVVAVDGTDVHDPGELQDTSVGVTAGGRAELEVVVPADGSGVRVEMGGSALLLGAGDLPRVPHPARELDLLSYGSPAPLGFDPATADRSFDYVIGRRPGFLDGLPGLWWTINGHMFPDVPMFVVDEGDVVRMHIENGSGEVHPMHLHGHHAVVLARNGVAATGSPWWFDSLDVADGESYDVAFVADNPGIWMDHCHNLPHATEGLVTHLMYEGVTEPYRVGGDTVNEPE